ncbi:hypothetical protein GMST_18590 [Geomonas silvestris]|uniref:YkuD domain-containing protein n=1 Tax=Geomonas silvestris TaxID=2740184 RepID=A0A6V8MHZ2_9BACT|nr:M15 family metallopeptidase [Geomonas silvestris]GFO59534.1 hypothetical protein GMST_18590 [Geomonas silvestris]
MATITSLTISLAADRPTFPCRVLGAVLCALLLALTGCAPLNLSPAGGGAETGLPAANRRLLDRLLPGALPGDQVVYVDPSASAPTRGTLYLLTRDSGGWETVLGPVAVNLGRNGVAPPWEKREGDGRTPAGLFPLTRSFGAGAGAPGALPYRQVGPDDIWVDDPLSADYNRRVLRGAVAPRSFENLLRADQLYRWVLVVDYNDDPVLRGMGSAIFFHLERAPGAPSAGCISLAEAPLLRLLGWLDPKRHPHLALGSPADLAALARGIPSAFSADLPHTLRDRLAGGRPLALARQGEYLGGAVTLPAELARRMAETGSWRPGCPVAPADLAYLVVRYRGLDGLSHYGELVLHAALAPLALDALEGAYRSGFPIASLRLIEEFAGDDARSMAANNSSGFNCRSVPGKPGTLSRHSYGTAIDLNPLQNPFLSLNREALPLLGLDRAAPEAQVLERSGCRENASSCLCPRYPDACQVAPPGAAGFLERDRPRPGMLLEGGAPLAAWLQRGFLWGGDWRFPDYQHLDFPLRSLGLSAPHPHPSPP